MLASISKDDKLFTLLLLVAVCLIAIILATNVYDSLYPPLFAGPTFNVEEVVKRIQKAGLTPREAMYYRIIQKDRRGRVKEIERVKTK